MAKNLLIVESPAKAKTIGKYLGDDFIVKSSFGHIRDLEKENMGIDIDNGFHPRYVVSADKKKTVAELKKIAKESKEIWLATDEDREGEAISWHLCEVLNLNPEDTKRIVFHEITKSAIQNAVKTPRIVDMNLVNAQQARRVLDRLVGFEISPVLWRKLSGGSSLSAGRVQSVTVRLIVEREREITTFKSDSFFKIEGHFSTLDIHGKPTSFRALGKKQNTKKEAYAFVEKCNDALFQVTDLQVKPGKRRPAPPFTTSTLQQEASRKLGMSVSRTMRVAQSLYENGYITYMRTDSVNLSESALQQAKEVVKSHYGDEYHELRRYKTKSQSAQEAHEAIRPTNFELKSIPIKESQKLYELIWKRTMATQMADAETEKTTAKISISTLPDEFLIASGEVIKFEGFLKAYTEGKDEGEEEAAEGMLPPLHKGQNLPLEQLIATQTFTRPKPRYTEASVVKKLEELGIGRPSTYAPTISTVQQRGYVERGDKEGIPRLYEVFILKNKKIEEQTRTETAGGDKNKLFPTDLGIVVTDFLIQHFPQVMDYKFTANIENEFDKIARGEQVWNKMISSFYAPFHKEVEETMIHAEKEKGERKLGVDPESGKPVIARLGRFGPMVQMGEQSEEEKPRFASLKPKQSIETITLEEALDLFKLPFTLEDIEGETVSVNTGRYGPYIKCGEKFVSIPRDEDPLSVNQKRAIEIIANKKKADAPIANFEGKPVTKGKGRFGPFLKWEDMYINVPKAYDFENLSQKDIDTLIEQKRAKEANRYIKQWPEEKISLENGHWGPFIRIDKKRINIGKKKNGEKYEAADLTDISIEEIKDIINSKNPEILKKRGKKSRPSKKRVESKTKRKQGTKSKVKKYKN